MAPSDPSAPSAIQTAFVGEVSPRLHARLDSELVRKALSYCKNMEPLPQGSLRTRVGSDYIWNLAGDGYSRLIPFPWSGGEDFIVELLDLALAIYSPTAGRLVLTGGEVECIQNTDFGGGVETPWTHTLDGIPDPNAPNIQFVAHAGGGLARFTPAFAAAGNWNAYLRQTINVTQAGTLKLRWDTYAWSQFDVRLGTTPDGWDLFRYQGMPRGKKEFDAGSVAGATTVYITIIGKPSMTPSLKTDWHDISLKRSSPGNELSLVTPWAKNEVHEVQYVAETGTDRMIFVHPKYQPRYLQRASDGTWSFAPCVFTGAPASWTGSNWPAVVELFQGRSWWGATPALKNTFWASKSGDPFNLTTGSNAGDGFSLDVATKGAIRWMQGKKIMLVGTERAEYSLSSPEGVVTPGSFDMHEESAFGSAKWQAFHLGDQVLFLSRDLRKIRAMNYSLQEDGYVSKDVTFLGEHITAGLVDELHFARSPHATIALVLQDGTMAFCTYERAEGVAAWWRADLGGFVVSAAVSEGGATGSQIFVAVVRKNGVLLERLDLANVRLDRLDSSVLKQAIGGVVYGLLHLNNEEVYVVAGEKVFGPITVSGVMATLPTLDVVTGTNDRIDINRTAGPHVVQAGVNDAIDFAVTTGFIESYGVTAGVNDQVAWKCQNDGVTHTATIPAGAYDLTGLAQAIQTAMRAVYGGAAVWTVSALPYSPPYILFEHNGAVAGAPHVTGHHLVTMLFGTGGQRCQALAWMLGWNAVDVDTTWAVGDISTLGDQAHPPRGTSAYFTATIAPGNYATLAALCAAVDAALSAADAGAGWTVTADGYGKLTILRNTGAFFGWTALWLTGGHHATTAAAVLGFDGSADQVAQLQQGGYNYQIVGAGPAVQTLFAGPATVAAGNYSLAALVTAVGNALVAADPTGDWANHCDSPGRWVIDSLFAFTLLWASGANHARSIAALLGYYTTEDLAGSPASGRYAAQAQGDHADVPVGNETLRVGIKYQQKVVTLPPALRSKQRRARVVLRLNDSAVPLVNGERCQPVKPQPSAIMTGAVVANCLGWDEDAAITIEQDKPLRTEVLAIFGNLRENEV